MSSIPIFFRHVIKLKPLEEEINDDIVEEGLVLQAEVVLCVDGDCVRASWRKLTIFLVFLKK